MFVYINNQYFVKFSQYLVTNHQYSSNLVCGTIIFRPEHSFGHNQIWKLDCADLDNLDGPFFKLAKAICFQKAWTNIAGAALAGALWMRRSKFPENKKHSCFGKSEQIWHFKEPSFDKGCKLPASSFTPEAIIIIVEGALFIQRGPLVRIWSSEFA